MTELQEKPKLGSDQDIAAGGFDELRGYLEVISKRKWIVLATLAFVVVATVLHTMRQTKIYQSTASLVIDPAPPQVLGAQVQEIVQLGTGSFWSNKEYYQTQVEILKSYQLARRAVEEHDLDLDPDLALVHSGDDGSTRAERIHEAAGNLSSRIAIDKSPDSRIVRVSVRHRHAAAGAQLANKVVETYIDYNLNLRSDGTDQAARWLARELDTAEDSLRRSEMDLYEFREEKEILSLDLEDRQNLLAGNIEKFTAKVADAKAVRIQLGAIRDRVVTLSDGELMESPIFGIIEGSTDGVPMLKNEYLAATQAFVTVAAELGERHPSYVAAKKRADALYAALESEARLARKQIEEQHKAALATERAFQRELDNYTQEAISLGPLEVKYRRLVRQRRSDEEKYSIVLERLRASDLTSRLRTSNIRDLDPAQGGYLVYPNMKRSVALAVVVGLVIGLLLAFIIDFLDQSIKGAEDVEAAVGAPALGIIPIVSTPTGVDRDKAQRERDMHVFENPTSTAAECCRSIRTNILFAGADRPMKVLSVLSPNPREGKTTSVVYLGTTMAQSGQKVLLVDTDLRRPRIHKSMNVSRATGLSNVIVGDAELDDVIKTTDIPNLYVLPCGPTPPNPAELLLTQKFRDTLAELAKRFDRVILDSPPLLAVTDGVVLASLADGVIMVVQAGGTRRPDAARAAKFLSDVNIRFAGVILNDMDITDKKYGYYYRYYNYGYGERQETAVEGSS